MRLFARGWLVGMVAAGAWGQGASGPGAERPLPPLAELRQRAVASYNRSEAQRERYLCRERIRGEELDGKGNVKKVDNFEREIFFVHGAQVSQIVSRDGKPLPADEQRKQDERVKKRIQEAQKKGTSSGPGGDLQVQDILRLAQFDHERRVMVAGRPTIVFDLVPIKGGHMFDVKQEIVNALGGTASVDEATGNLQDLNARGVRDVKVGGGLVANVHKGFQIHVVLAPEPDGVWLLRMADGAGDARVGLFVKEGGRFRQETEGCRLYDVDAQQSGDKVKGQ